MHAPSSPGATLEPRPTRPRRRRWAWPLIGLALLYLLANCTLYGLQRSLVFQPWTGGDAGTAAAAGMTAVKTVAADGIAVTHWYAAPRGATAPVIVLFHGNGGTVADLEPWAAAFRKRGWGVVLADYRGYSGNSGDPSETGVYADARAVLAWLRQQGIDDRRIVILGWSLGSGVAVQMALEHHPAAVVLFAPYTSLVDVAAADYPLFPVRSLMIDRFESMSKITGIGAPLMVVHGEADEVIPTVMGERLLAHAHEPKRGLFLPGVGHWIPPGRAVADVAGFIQENAPAR
jgi:fermentation-respiration switch protein FrsA (DUF1100 family)